MHSSNFIVILIFLIFSEKINAQSIFKGKVLDSLGNKLEYVNVVLITSSKKKFVSFDITDKDGRFEIKSTIPKDSLIISFSHISYQKESFILSEFEIDSIVIVMKPDNFELEEIEIHEKTNFIRKNDTISYNLDFYRDSSEQNIGELLQKIPGIKVDASGNISVYSKPISSLTIDGVNITKNKYQVVTSNLRADIVTKAEIILNYVENDLLRTFFTESDAVSINLVTIEKYKNTTTGNLDIGLNYKNYELIANIFSLGRNIKLINSTDLNNIGRGSQKIIQLQNYLLPNYGLNVELSPLWANQYSSFDRDLIRKNTLFKSRIDAVLFPSLKETKINLNIEGNVEDFNQSSLSNYYNYNIGLYRKEENTLKNKIRDIYIGLLITKNIKKNQQFNIILNYDFTGASRTNQINISNWISQNQRNGTNIKFQYLNKISSKLISISEVEVDNKITNLNFDFNFATFEHGKYNFPTPYKSNIFTTLSSNKLNHTFFVKASKNILGIRFDYENYFFKSNNTTNDTQDELAKISLSLKENYKYSKKGELAGLLEVGTLRSDQFRLINFNNSTNRNYLNINVNWKQAINAKIDGQIFLNKTNNIEQIQLSKLPFWAYPFSLLDNIYPFRPYNTYEFGQLFKYSSNYPAIHISNNFSYSLTDYNFIGADSIIGSSVITKIIFNPTQQYQISNSLSFDYFIDLINTAFKSSTSYSHGKIPFITNGIMTNSKSKTWSTSIFLRSAFVFPINFEIGIEYINFNIENTIILSAVNNNTVYKKNILELMFKQKDFSLNIKNYLFQTKNYAAEFSNSNFISDLDLSIKIKKGNIDVIIYNLFDKNQLNYINKTITGEIVSQTLLNSRILLIKYKIKF